MSTMRTRSSSRAAVPRRAPHRRHRDPDRSSTLLLFPAGVVVVLMLASIAVDTSAVFLAQRQLRRACAQAADDAVTALDVAALRRNGDTRLDVDTARRIVRLHLATSTLVAHLDGEPRITVDPDAATVDIVATGTVRPVFGRGVGLGDRKVTAHVRGRLTDRD
ncbi:MAG: hypothetical protein R2698_00925 [Microthrixaceae bacterium]